MKNSVNASMWTVSNDSEQSLELHRFGANHDSTIDDINVHGVTDIIRKTKMYDDVKVTVIQLVTEKGVIEINAFREDSQ